MALVAISLPCPLRDFAPAPIASPARSADCRLCFHPLEEAFRSLTSASMAWEQKFAAPPGCEVLGGAEVTLKRRVCLPGEGRWVNAWWLGSFLVGSTVHVRAWL
jgi:hypothetical protein